MITFTGESIRLGYTASRFQTGLTVKIDIWDNSMAKLVDAGSMTELANGFYYYDYSPSDVGVFTARLYATDGVSPVTVFKTFKVYGRQSPIYSKRGGSGVIFHEKDDSKLTASLESIAKNVSELHDVIKLIPLDNSDLNISKLIQQFIEIKTDIHELSDLLLKNIDSKTLADST